MSDAPTVEVPAPGRLLKLLSGFVHELRAAGLPVSMTENLDAMRALEYVPLDDRSASGSSSAGSSPSAPPGAPRSIIRSASAS